MVKDINILESWKEYPQEIIKDRNFVGGKAAGLLMLPTDWTPPFIVLTKNFYSSWLKTKNALKTITALPQYEQDLISKFFEQSCRSDRKTYSKIIIRSNSPEECLYYPW